MVGGSPFWSCETLSIKGTGTVAQGGQCGGVAILDARFPLDLRRADDPGVVASKGLFP